MKTTGTHSWHCWRQPAPEPQRGIYDVSGTFPEAIILVIVSSAEGNVGSNGSDRSRASASPQGRSIDSIQLFTRETRSSKRASVRRQSCRQDIAKQIAATRNRSTSRNPGTAPRAEPDDPVECGEHQAIDDIKFPTRKYFEK